MKSLVALMLASLALAGCLSSPDETPAPTPVDRNYDGVVVVAVVDSRTNPYLYDFHGDHMPQHRNADPMDDLPLDEDPSTWVPGFPDPASFASFNRLDLSLADDESTRSNELHDADAAQWDKVKQSSGNENGGIHYNYVPGTKVIGHITFNSGDGYAASSHGVGTSTVAVGNYHGSCPECLLVFVDGTREEANEWVAKQDWIDAQTNSWGLSTGLRDRMYAGSDTELQKEAVSRGQQIFFSAGNGQANTFTAPNPTLFSSQEGPDWIITVGAINPNDGSSYSGHGKPSDIAAVGSGYPSGGYCDGTVNCTGNFGGTSNATPVTAGMYAKALHELRRIMQTTTRVQSEGVIAQGNGNCGEANPTCALADGVLTIDELRTALFQAAGNNAPGWTTGGANYESTDEMTFLAEGHGSFWAKLRPDDYTAEVNRILGYATGTIEHDQSQDELEWFIVDSWCRQILWGSWDGGYFVAGNTTLPAADPEWPARTNTLQECPTTWKAIVDAEKQRDRA